MLVLYSFWSKVHTFSSLKSKVWANSNTISMSLYKCQSYHFSGILSKYIIFGILFPCFLWVLFLICLMELCASNSRHSQIKWSGNHPKKFHKRHTDIQRGDHKAKYCNSQNCNIMTDFLGLFWSIQLTYTV